MINDVIQLLGIANPQMSLQWTLAAGTVLNYDNAFTLTCNNDRFVAPIGGFLNVNRGLEKIVLPFGNTPTAGVVIKMDPQVYLRITRMYATEIENQAVNTFLTERPVPCYFVYTNVTNQAWVDADNNNKNGPDEGLVLAGNDLRLSGTLTIHDQYGFPIDPVAVAAAFNAFVVKFDTLESKALNSAAISANAHQIAAIAALGTAGLTTLQLITPNGNPFSTGAASFKNITGLNGPQGFYKIDAPGTVINKQPAATADTKIAAATNGLFADTYTIRPRKANIALPRDFLRAYVVSLNSYLLGNAPGNEPSVQALVAPVVQDNEQITLLVNGNECLGAVNNITAANPALTLLASQVIEDDFVLPPLAAGNGNERWPAFPAVPAGQPAPVPPFIAIPANIKNNFVLAAHFIQDQPTLNSDVAVTLTCPQFIHGDSIRIYDRIFNDDDGSESRGDGAGALVIGTTATFRLKDPFNQVNGVGVQVETYVNPSLMLDAVLTNRGSFKRTFGNLHCIVAAPAALTLAETQALAAPGLNNFNMVAERGISPAGISGTSMTPNPGGNFGNFLLSMVGENQPRNPPRYPTMARNDSMAASFAGGNWRAFCGGTIFKKDALNNFPLMGNPGSPGGKEYSSVGVYTQNGVLAYDIARAAYRRTRNIAERMGHFMFGATANSWNTPNAPVAGANNTWAAATLQTIANHCETPEIGLEFTDMSKVPNTLAQFIIDVQTALGANPLPNWIPAALRPRLQAAITNLGTNAQNQRAYDEMRREFASSLYGRRDTYWALLNAVGNAKECIYIQGTFLGRTAYGVNDPQIGNEFIELIKGLLDVNARLKVIICLSKPIHYGEGYEVIESREYLQRKAVVEYLQGDPDPVTHIRAKANQVLAFHPNGFPMRPKVLQHQVVVVDDMWALVGSSTFRRRGMQFDGGQDIVMIDKTITNGKSAGIKNFRIKLMQEHLNLQNNAGLTPGLQIRLNDLHESFYAIRELLDSGGAGVISPIWEGDRTAITINTHPSDDLADPSSNNFDIDGAALSALIGALSTTPV